MKILFWEDWSGGYVKDALERGNKNRIGWELLQWPMYRIVTEKNGKDRNLPLMIQNSASQNHIKMWIKITSIYCHIYMYYKEKFLIVLGKQRFIYPMNVITFPYSLLFNVYIQWYILRTIRNVSNYV